MGSTTKEKAESICASFSKDFDDKKPSPKVITIKNEEQQKFLLKFLQSANKTTDNIWLGLELNNQTGQLIWNDGSKMEFHNLANANDTGVIKECVQMNSNDTGLWHYVDCTELSKVVCERDIIWPLESLQEYQQDSSNLTQRLDWSDIKSESDCKEKIVRSESKNELLNDAAEKAIEVLKDATDKIAETEESEIRTREIGKFSV